jgi:hypothetical protein
MCCSTVRLRQRCGCSSSSSSRSSSSLYVLLQRGTTAVCAASCTHLSQVHCHAIQAYFAAPLPAPNQPTCSLSALQIVSNALQDIPNIIAAAREQRNERLGVQASMRDVTNPDTHVVLYLQVGLRCHCCCCRCCVCLFVSIGLCVAARGSYTCSFVQLTIRKANV